MSFDTYLSLKCSCCSQFLLIELETIMKSFILTVTTKSWKPEYHQASQVLFYRFSDLFDFLGRGHTVLWTRKSMSNNSSILGGKLWWDLTVCRSEWRITNAVFQAWAASPTRPPCLWPLWQVFDWPLSSQFWGLCGRSRSCRHQLDFQDRRRCRWMFDKDLSTWFFPFQVPTPVCHPPNFKQTVTDMTASSANSIIFAYWVWHDPAQNGLKFKLNCFRGVWGGGGGSLGGETRTVDGNLLPVKAC